MSSLSSFSIVKMEVFRCSIRSYALLFIYVLTCSWYTYHLTLHRLRQVLDLHHGYPMCQPHEVCMNASEHLLHIHTHDVISSSPPSMMMETVRPLWSYICIHMRDHHYVLSHKNMSFGSIYQKKQKK